MSPGQNHAWLLPDHLRPPDGNAIANGNQTSSPNPSNAPSKPILNASANANATATATATAAADPTPAQHPNPSSDSPIGVDSLGSGNANPTLNGNPARSLTPASAAAADPRFRAPGSAFSPSALMNGVTIDAVSPGGGAQHSHNAPAGDDNVGSAKTTAEDDPRIALFRDRYAQTEARINALFSNEARRSFINPTKENEEESLLLLLSKEDHAAAGPSSSGQQPAGDNTTSVTTDAKGNAAAPATAPAATTTTDPQSSQQPSRKAARKLDDDDYDEYDEDEDEDDGDAPPAATTAQQPSTASTTSSTIPLLPLTTVAPPTPTPTVTLNPQQPQVQQPPTRNQQPKQESAEDVRKKLEQDKKQMEESVKRSFHTMFFTLEDDRNAMLDQQKLEETERQIEAEMYAQGANSQHAGANAQGHASGGPTSGPNQSGRPGEIGSGYGPLSNVNLGSSSLALKNLIERIDMKRSEVMASDAELRNLMSEVRKNRSKWASEEKIGQEELYEPAEKVLNMLKAETTHSAPFLTRVNKREAPDYYNVITHPMDLGTMTKKLKNMVYKSKTEFVGDLNLIWANCLKYNTNPDHPLRKHALYMRKVSAELEPMIPDVVVRDRAEVEAEERRLQMAELDGAEESDDEPIMTSRGRKAVGKGTRKGKGVGARATTTRTGTAEKSQTPAPGGQKDDVQGQFSLTASQNRPPSIAPTGSDLQSETQGTPPPGFFTPGTSSGGQLANDGMEGMDLESYGPMATAATSNFSRPIIDFENPEYKMWKQVTQKGRAKVTAERYRLFKGDKLNTDEPALLRTKAGMRRWLRGKMEGAGNAAEGLNSSSVSGTGNINRPATTNSLAQNAPTTTGETLAENMDQEENRPLPDYYDVMSAVPDIPEQLRWVEDSEGNIVDMSEEYLSMLPKGRFVQPTSNFTKKLDANMRQMQETRKICSKVSIVKQMQVQSQMYQNQFQKYNPEPFVEQDVPPHVMNHSGPVISPWIARAALQRSVGKICYHVGFEEFQPSALDAITDVAADFFHRLGGAFKTYLEVPRISAAEDDPEVVKSEAEDDKSVKPSTAPEAAQVKRPLKGEEIIRHTLNSVGLDPETLESYVTDDIERIGAKLGQLHERLKLHLAELLRPGLQDTSGDGSAMFNDGSEQFIGGDFAVDIDEDFFGFKELGLDQEFGLASLTVPLHLLQNRMYNAHRSQHPAALPNAAAAFPSPPKFPAITMENVSKQIGLVQKFLLAKLKKNDGRPLVEDMDLPPKQRPNPARPRLPATGKIAPIIVSAAKKDNTISPAKRPAPSSSKKDLASPTKKKSRKNPAGAGGGSEKKDSADAGRRD